MFFPVRAFPESLKKGNVQFESKPLDLSQPPASRAAVYCISRNITIFIPAARSDCFRNTSKALVVNFSIESAWYRQASASDDDDNATSIGRRASLVNYVNNHYDEFDTLKYGRLRAN